MARIKNFSSEQVLRILFVGLLLVAGAHLIEAQTYVGPSCSPPGCNVEAPLNVSGYEQRKKGSLVLEGITPTGGVYNTAFAVLSGYSGFGTFNPTERVHIAGKLRIADGTQASGRILASDANGVASWISPTTASAVIPSYVTNSCSGGVDAYSFSCAALCPAGKKAIGGDCVKTTGTGSLSNGFQTLTPDRGGWTCRYISSSASDAGTGRQLDVTAVCL